MWNNRMLLQDQESTKTIIWKMKNNLHNEHQIYTYLHIRNVKNREIKFNKYESGFILDWEKKAIRRIISSFKVEDFLKIKDS